MANFKEMAEFENFSFIDIVFSTPKYITKSIWQ